MLFGNPITTAAPADLDRNGFTVDDLHKAIGVIDEEAAFADMPAGRQIDDIQILCVFQLEMDRCGFAVVKAFRKKIDGSR